MCIFLVLLAIFSCSKYSAGATNVATFTCPSSDRQCSSSDFQHWKCCPDRQIAFPSVRSCRNGTLEESMCFASDPLAVENFRNENINAGRYLPLNLSLQLTKPAHVYAVVLTVYESNVQGRVNSFIRVQTKTRQQSNATKLTDCTFAGRLKNTSFTFYCGQPNGTFSDGVLISKRNTKETVSIGGFRIYEHLGIGCGYPGEREPRSFEPEMEFYPVGSRVRYSCKDGAILVGNRDRICSSKGLWMGAIPHCIPEVDVDPTLVDGDLAELLTASSCLPIQSGFLKFQNPGLKIHKLYTHGKGLNSCSVSLQRGKNAIKTLWNPEPNSSAVASVYRSSQDTPTDRIDVECSSDAELCRIRLTQVPDLHEPPLCPSPDGIANGNYSIGAEGVRFTCYSGYRPTSESQPMSCVDGDWNSSPPTCKRVQCDYPENINGTHWNLVQSSTTVGSLVEYRSWIDRTKILLFVCDETGQWSITNSSRNEHAEEPTSSTTNSDAYIQAYWILVPFVLLVVLAVQIIHYRHAIYRRCCFCLHKKTASQQLEVYYNNSLPSDNNSGMHSPELLPYNDEPEYPAEHLYESISLSGSLDNLTAHSYATIAPKTTGLEIL